MTIALASALAHDAVLPRRDMLLDADVMAARLERMLGVTVTAYAQARVKYRVGESLRVVHRVEDAGVSALVSSRMFRGGESADVFERALARAVPAPGGFAPVAHDEELGTVFWTFPNDRRLTALTALQAGDARLAQLVGQSVRRTVIAAYAPEKSATAACFGAAGDGPLAYVKAFGGRAAAAWSARVHADVAARLGDGHPLLRVPAVLAYDGDAGLVAVEALQGRRLDTLAADDVVTAMRRYGAAVATLHALAPPPDAPAFARVAPDRRRSATALIAAARPDVATQAGRLAEALDAAAPAPGAEPAVCLHGDVHAKNAIAQPDGRIALIDLDQLAVGPASAELGSMLAGLRYHALVGGEGVATTLPAERAFLAGYAGVRELPAPGALRWSIAAALLCERALRAVNRVRPDGLARLGGVLDEAEASLRGDAR